MAHAIERSGALRSGGRSPDTPHRGASIEAPGEQIASHSPQRPAKRLEGSVAKKLSKSGGTSGVSELYILPPPNHPLTR